MRASLHALLATSLMVAGLLATAGPAVADHGVTPARVAGDTRIETAAEVATLQYDQVDGVILAAQGTFPDALAAAPLAGELEVPILLTAQDHVPVATLEALDELGTAGITIVGGPAAVSLGVEEDLRDRGYQVGRVAGETRFDTAADIAAAVQNAQGGVANFPGDVRAAFLANGFRFPDALTAGAPAARGPAQIPIVLSEQDVVPVATLAFLDEHDIETVVVVGGPVAIDDEVVHDLQARDYTVVRVDGETRTQTATEMADFVIEFLGFNATRPAIARGDAFPDALAIGPFQAAQASPILLTDDPNTLTEHTENWLAAACPEVEVVRAVGGELAITTNTLNHAILAAQSCHAAPSDDPDQDYIVAPQEPQTSEPGTPVAFSTGARFDDDAFADVLDVALFPCGQADVVGPGEPVFADADEDGFADGIFTTDAGSAGIISVEGEVPEGGATTDVEDVSPGDDGVVSVEIDSNTADCTVVVFYEDVNEDDQLSVNAEGHPIEPYGVGQVTFTSP